MTNKRAATAYIFFVALCTVHHVLANWWYLAMPEALIRINELTPHNLNESCQKFSYLAPRQQVLCTISNKYLVTVSNGARMAIDECQYQFKNSRWNCSTMSNSTTVFGSMLNIPSRESAFVHAISSAGVAFAVTRACSSGHLNNCNCDQRVLLRKTGNTWKYGGCSEDIQFGEKFSRDFVDSKENAETADGLMNLHNNEAGRRTIRGRMQRLCKCHGVSGSCSMRVCWRRLPPFRVVGDLLAARFDGATHVKPVERKRRRMRRPQQIAADSPGHRSLMLPSKKLRAISRDLKPPNKTDLVYLQESPDYCDLNETLNILGTRGRACNRTSLGLDGCRLLCCGRGYQTRMRDVEEKCQCRFVWCCDVVCQMCRYRKDEHVCN